jgi:UDP-glucose 4-epimerase
MRVCVTGGAGFIGSNLVKRLREQGHEVAVLDDLSSGYVQNLAGMPDVRFVQGDVRDASAVAHACEGAETVFHLAAAVGNKRSIDDPFDDASRNAVGTLTVLEAIRRYGIRKVVFSSSAGVFGELVRLPIAEDHPVEPDSPYGVSKLAAEKLCLAYGRLYGFSAVCLRYFNVYGRHQRFDAYGNVIPIFVTRALRGEPLTIYGDGQQTRDFVHVDDVVQANVRAAAAPEVSGAFNIGSATAVTINDLASLVLELTASSVPPIHAGPRPGDVRDSLADISRARRDFGFAPSTGLRAGLEAYVDWMRADLAPCVTGTAAAARA